MSITNNDTEELRIRCDALRGLLFAECGLELDEIAALEQAALDDFKANIKPDTSLIPAAASPDAFAVPPAAD